MKYKINLIKEDKRKKNLLDKIIYFSLYYLRYILVFTQLVVIIVFFYRFKLDQEIIDLKDRLNQKKEIVQISKNLLEEARKYELKLNYIKPILDKQNQQLEKVNYLLSIFPNDIYLETMSIDEDEINLSGFSYNNKIIKLFYNRLIRDKKFAEVNLSDLKKTNIGYVFNLQLKKFL